MLGRTASSLYWMSRYMERAENMARLLEVGHRISLMPGAIHAVFTDGHVEGIKLERLWTLSWHRGYKEPAKRPN